MNPKISKFATILLFFLGVFTFCTKNDVQTASLENSFGLNGRVIIPNTSEISSLDFDSHYNIVAVGYTLIENGRCHLTIAKTKPNGTIDNNFGDNGLVKVTDYHDSSPMDLKVTNSNKILVIGSFTKIQFQGRETIMMRFNEDGTVDQSFGNNGKVNLDFNAGDIISLNFDSDDFMLIAKYVFETIETNGVLYRNLTGYSISKYNYEGVIDNSFGENGVVHLTNSISTNCMKILNDGSIVVAGTYYVQPESELGMCKLTPKGELDATFADGGIWHMNIIEDLGWTNEVFSNILEDNNGSLILSGPGNYATFTSMIQPFLSKFSANGKLDTSFGENGFYWFGNRLIHNPLLQIGDKYIVSSWHDERNKIVCVNNKGTVAQDVYTSEIYYLQDMKLFGKNQIILGGGYKIGDSYHANFALEKINF